jgi:hypothetical protein
MITLNPFKAVAQITPLMISQGFQVEPDAPDEPETIEPEQPEEPMEDTEDEEPAEDSMNSPKVAPLV